MSAMTHPPVALTIAGSDCSGGAGLQADCKVFQHFGIHGLTAVTCVVSETASTVRAVHPVPPEILADQVSLLLDSFPLAAIKTGMLFSATHVRTVAALLQSSRTAQLVIDPVMIASTGDSLLEPDALTAYTEDLLPFATLTTPNLPEAEALLGMTIPDKTSAGQAALELASRFGISVLIKGGHGTSTSCDDVLAHRGEVHWFHAPRLPHPASHGTGCTLSAAITARLAHGDELISAISQAKSFISAAISHGYTFPGPSPIHALNQGTIPWATRLPSNGN